MISKQRIYLTEDRKKAVPAGHPEAAHLLVHEGGEVSDKVLDKIEGATELVSSPRTYVPEDFGDGPEPRKPKGRQPKGKPEDQPEE